LFKPAGIGLLVQNPGGTGAMLGLYGNDMLMKADGAQLGNLDDVVRLVLEPLSRNESVVVSGARSGQPREWIYAGVNCLAR
jgi:S1-C subfamily serine protease